MGIILKKFTNIKVAMKVLPINMRYLLITKKYFYNNLTLRFFMKTIPFL